MVCLFHHGFLHLLHGEVLTACYYICEDVIPQWSREEDSQWGEVQDVQLSTET